MSRKNISVVIVIGVIIILGLYFSIKNTNTGVIKIGFIGPLSGDAADIGETVLNGARLAEKEINALGGINGRQIEIVYEDGKCNGKDAVTAGQKLINIDKVKYIAGGICSGEVFSFAPLAEEARVVVISPSATNPDIANLGDYIFRNAPNDGLRGIVIADRLIAMGFSKPAIVSEKTDYSQGLRTAYIERLKEKGVTVASDEQYETGEIDFKSILSKVKQSGADALFIAAQTPTNIVRLAKQARSIGIKAQFITSEFNGPDVLSGGSDVEGLLIAVASDLAQNDQARLMVENYKKDFGKDIRYAYYVGAEYDAIKILAQAIASVGDNSQKVKDYLYGIKSYDGTIGTYHFETNGDVDGVGFVFQQVKNNVSVPIQ